MKIINTVEEGNKDQFEISNGLLKIIGRVCVLDVDSLQKEKLDEVHSFVYAMHPGVIKMYHTMKPHFWWPGMKREAARHILTCIVGQKTKVEHNTPSGKLQSLPIPD